MYLLQIRPSRRVKKRLRDIIYDVDEEFDTRSVDDPRPVPHISLFGPYDTKRGKECKNRLLDVASDYHCIPYRIDGFGRFRDTNVVYANVVPSQKLRSVRRKLSKQQRPLSTNYPDYDRDYYYKFHITIARPSATEKVNTILGYLQDDYGLEINDYATRLTALDGRSIMYEYDIPRGELLSKEQATNQDEWVETKSALEKYTSSNDHADLAPLPDIATRVLTTAKWKVANASVLP